jgi:C4-dicarboxylate transporter DctQ subunit
LKVLDRFEESFITFLMGGATLLIFVAVVHRYAAGWHIPVLQDFLLKVDLSWAQELCIIMFVWMAKFGAAYGVRTGIHVGVDVLINRLSDRNRFKLIVFGLLAGALFTGIVAALGGHFVWENGAHYAFLRLFGIDAGDMYPGPKTPDLEWPTWIVYSAIPLGSSLMCFRFLQVLAAFVRTGDLPHHDHGHVEGLDEVISREPGAEDQVLRLDDDLHPRDMHEPRADEDRDGKRNP